MAARKDGCTCGIVVRCKLEGFPFLPPPEVLVQAQHAAPILRGLCAALPLCEKSDVVGSPERSTPSHDVVIAVVTVNLKRGVSV